MRATQPSVNQKQIRKIVTVKVRTRMVNPKTRMVMLKAKMMILKDRDQKSQLWRLRLQKVRASLWSNTQVSFQNVSSSCLTFLASPKRGLSYRWAGSHLVMVTSDKNISVKAFPAPLLDQSINQYESITSQATFNKIGLEPACWLNVSFAEDDRPSADAPSPVAVTPANSQAELAFILPLPSTYGEFEALVAGRHAEGLSTAVKRIRVSNKPALAADGKKGLQVDFAHQSPNFFSQIPMSSVHKF